MGADPQRKLKEEIRESEMRARTPETKLIKSYPDSLEKKKECKRHLEVWTL